MDFIIDTTGSDNLQPSNISYKEQESRDDSVLNSLQDYKTSLDAQSSRNLHRSKNAKNENIFKKFYADMGWDVETPATNSTKNDIKKVLEKSVITPEFEQLHAVPAYDVSERILKKQRKKERELTKGSKWYGLPATEMTEEAKNDLEVLRMRSVLDPKHFYKKNDLKVLPKYFQVGKVMDSPLDFYNSRLTKKERKKTLVDELLADANFNKYNKRKYLEIIQEREKTHYKAYRQAKKLKRKNKK